MPLGEAGDDFCVRIQQNLQSTLIEYANNAATNR